MALFWRKQKLKRSKAVEDMPGKATLLAMAGSRVVIEDFNRRRSQLYLHGRWRKRFSNKWPHQPMIIKARDTMAILAAQTLAAWVLTLLLPVCLHHEDS